MGPLALGRRASARPCHSLRLTMALVCNDPLGGIWVGICKRDGEELFFVQDTTHGVLCTMALSNAAIIPNSIPPSNIDLGSQARKKNTRPHNKIPAGTAKKQAPRTALF